MTEYVTTGDGSITLLDSETGELYHNRAGAYTEALMSYVEPSRAIEKLQARHQIHVLDVCFGLGYNTFVLLQKAIEQQARGVIEVTAVESDANVIATTRDVLLSNRFDKLRKFFHSETFATHPRRICATFGGLHIAFNLLHGDARVLIPALQLPVDYVFHDPFSPRRMPELWTVQLFQEYRRLLDGRRGMLLTYSTAPSVCGGLRDAGFHLYRTAAVGDKPGGTLAAVESRTSTVSVIDLSDEERAKLAGKSGIPYRDEAFALSRDEILRRRQADMGNT